MDPNKEMYVQVRSDIRGADGARSYQPGILVNARFMTPSDGPFAMEHERARRLIKEGIVEAVAHAPADETPVRLQPESPVTRGAERAVESRAGAQRR